MAETAGEPIAMFRTPAGRARFLAAYDAVLADWPVAYEEFDVETRFGRTHVIASGPRDAPALLLLPSLAATATVWRPNVAALSRRFRAYAVDVIGQGGKSQAVARLTSRADFADWLDDLMDGLGVQRASFVGCSFGGFLALSQAALRPQRVERVVLISPAGTFVRLSWRFVLTMLSGSWRRRLRRLLGDRRAADIAALGFSRLRPEDGPWRALMAATLAERPRLNTINASVLSEAELRAIKAPTLLLIGEHERLYPPAATLARAKARMPALATALVPDADHVAALANPDDVNVRILQFLTEDAP